MRDLIKTFQKEEELIYEIERYNSDDSFKFWWLGQSGFLIKYKSEIILFDPYLSDSLTKKYAMTEKPHVRISDLVISPEKLIGINIVTSSHNHTDHLDAETLLPIFEKNKEIKFIIPEANRTFVSERLNCEIDFPIGLIQNKSVKIGEFEIVGLPAAHNSIEKDENGNCKFMGYICKFGKYVVYHSGDTLLYDGLEEILKSYNIDLAFLPINGNKPERKVAGNLNSEEAALLGKNAGVKLVVPHHYNLFEFNTEDPQLFVNKCTEFETPFKVLELGEGYEFI